MCPVQVFELLSQLPGFTRENWQSTIRRYVTVHPEYQDIEPWVGAETSDMVYDDSKGALTELSLAKATWRARSGLERHRSTSLR